MEYIFKRKTFTRWDDTDNLKRMKDSDILAEKKRKTTNYGSIAGTAAVGTAAGAGVGAVAGMFGGRGSSWLARRGNGILRGGKTGAVLGGLGAGYLAYRKGKKTADDNRHYNERLEYAQRQALRRERKDWKNNMTNREGYSY